MNTTHFKPKPTNLRPAFNQWLETNPNARFWNTSDAMFAAFIGGHVLQAAPAGEDEEHGVKDMLRDWQDQDRRRVELLEAHLRQVLEVARTWQPDYASKMDRDTLGQAAAEVGHTHPNAAPPAAGDEAKPMTDDEVQAVVTQAVRERRLSWLGFKQDDQGAYTVPVLSPSDYQFARAIERHHGIAAQSAEAGKVGG